MESSERVIWGVHAIRQLKIMRDSGDAAVCQSGHQIGGHPGWVKGVPHSLDAFYCIQKNFEDSVWRRFMGAINLIACTYPGNGSGTDSGPIRSGSELMRFRTSRR